jgi:hypothetical protein
MPLRSTAISADYKQNPLIEEESGWNSTGLTE